MKGFQPIQDTQEIVVAKLRGSDKGFQPIQVTQERVVGKRWVTNSYMFTGELIQGTQERVVVIEWVITAMGYTGESGGKMKGYLPLWGTEERVHSKKRQDHSSPKIAGKKLIILL